MLLRDARLRQGLHVQLHRGRNVRKVSVHAARFPPAAETLAAGYPAGGPLAHHPAAEQAPAGDQRLLLGYDAAVHVQHDLRRALPDPLPERGGLFVCVHCRVQHLHVRVRGDQVLFAVPVRGGEVLRVRPRGTVHHPDQRGHRERGRYLGAGRQEAQVLRGAEGRPGACYGLKRRELRLF